MKRELATYTLVHKSVRAFIRAPFVYLLIHGAEKNARETRRKKKKKNPGIIFLGNVVSVPHCLCIN